MTIAELLVRLGADPQGFLRGIEAAGEGFENFLFHLDRGSRALRSVGLASQAAGAAILAFAGIAVAAASQAEREQVLLEQAIRATGRAAAFNAAGLNEQAKALQRVTSFSDEAITEVQRLLVGFRLTQEHVEALTPRVLDLATRLGVDVATAANAVGRAFTFGVAGLRRLGVAVDENLDPLQDFEGFLRAIDKSSGGAARAAGQTFAGSLARLRNALDDLLEVLGAPILGPLAAFLNAATRAAESVRGFGAKFPGATAAVVRLSVVLGVFLLGAGGLIVLLALLPKVPVLLASWSTALGLVVGALTKGSALVKEFTASTATMNAELAKAAVATRAAARVILSMPGALKIATAALRVFATTLKAVGTGIVVAIAIDLAFRLIGKAIEKASKLLRPFLERIGLIAPSQADAKEAVDKLNEALRRQGQTLEQVEASYREAKAATDLFAAATKRMAAESARLELLRPGIDEAGVKAALERLQADQREAEVAAAEQSVATERNRLQKLLQIQAGFARQRDLGLEVSTEKEKQVADEIVEARLNVAKAEQAIADARVEAARASAEATARAEKEAAAARIEAEKEVRDASLALLRQRIEAEREAAARIEQVRADALRRVADLERSLSDAVLQAREALSRAAAAREDGIMRARAVERARLLREGFLLEEEAERQAAEDRFAQQRAAIERELDLRRLRVAEAARQAEAETAVAAAQFQAQEAIRQADLQAAIRTGRAETAARVAELRAQLAARKAELTAEVEARRAAGQITEAEARARADQIRAIEAGTQAQVAALLQGQAEKERALTEATVVQRAAAEQSLAAEVQRIQGELAATRAEGTADVVEAEEKLRALIAERREELREEGRLTPGQIEDQLRPALVLLDQVRRANQSAAARAQEDLGKVEAALKKVGDALAAALQPFVAAVESLQKLLAGPGIPALAGFPFLPQAPGAPGVPAAGVQAGAAGAQPAALLFQVQGDVVARLEGDRAAIALEVIGMLLGPEGNRLVEQYMKRTPGPRLPPP